jgi:hypothetical protein
VKLQLNGRALLTLWATAGVVALMACTAYQLPKQPASELAVIAIDRAPTAERSINGKQSL